MHLKRFTLLIIALLWCSDISAQKQATHWRFGQYVGFDFSKGCKPNTAQPGGMPVYEGASTMSDAVTGELLFYADAFDVWNRENEHMPNSGDGDTRPGVNRKYQALSQGSLIVPDPGNMSVYYLFSLIEQDPRDSTRKGPGALSYSRVDMRLDGGKGDVVVQDKNSFLADGLAGRLTAVRHANMRDYWLIAHQWNSNAFFVYPITSAGIGHADTVRIGSVLDMAFGILKASPDGKKLACSSRTLAAVAFDLFDFDASTGRISNHINLGPVRSGYGVSFSPDNSKLYLSTMDITASDYPEQIRQYDLNAGTTGNIISSGKSIVNQNPKTNINQQQDRYFEFFAPGIQLGPDGRIYCPSNANITGNRFFVINDPNKKGFDCNVMVESLELGSGSVGNSNDPPNFMQHYFNDILPLSCPPDEIKECEIGEIFLFPNPTNDFFRISVKADCFTPYNLRIINMAGQIVSKSFVDTEQSDKISVKQLPAGLYLAEIQFQNRIIVKRFFRF